MIAGGGRWLEVATLAGGWPKSGRKTPQKGPRLLVWVRPWGRERGRREEERESVLNYLVQNEAHVKINTWLKITLKSSFSLSIIKI